MESTKIYTNWSELFCADSNNLIYEMTPYTKDIIQLSSAIRYIAEVSSVFDSLIGVVDDPEIMRVFYSLNHSYYLEASKKYFADCQKTVWSFSDTPIKVVCFSLWSIYVETKETKSKEAIKIIGHVIPWLNRPHKSSLCFGNITDISWHENWLTMEEDPERKIRRKPDTITYFTKWKCIDSCIELS